MKNRKNHNSMSQYQKCHLLLEKIQNFQKKEGKVKIEITNDVFTPYIATVNHEAYVLSCLERLHKWNELTAADMVLLNKLYNAYKLY